MKRKPGSNPVQPKTTVLECSTISLNDGNLGDQVRGVARDGYAPRRNYRYKTFDDKDEMYDRLKNYRKKMKISTEDKTDATFTMQEALDSVEFGPYQVWLSVLFGLIYIADSMETMLVSVLVPAMRCVFKDVTPFQQALLPMISIIGLLVSGPFWGKLGDRYGRKPTLIISNIVSGYFGLLSALSPTYPWVIINRFFVSFAFGACLQMVGYYGEFLPTKARSTSIVALALIWAMGACFEVMIAMATLPSLQWRLFLAVSSCPITVFTICTLFLPESPRHLLAHGRYDEAMAVLRRVAKMNKKELPEGRLHHACGETLDSNNLADIFVPKYIKTTILMSLASIAISMAYYGTSYLVATLFDKRDGCHGYESGETSIQTASCQVYCKTLSEKDYADLLLTTLGEAPGIVFCVLVMASFSRKTSLTLMMGLFTLSVLACNICAPRNVLVGLFILAKAMAVASSQGGLLYATEVYPTSVRAIGLGWFASTKGIGCLVSAFSANVSLEYSSFLAISTLAAAGFIGTICFTLMPYETKDRKMLDTLKENAT